MKGTRILFAVILAAVAFGGAASATEPPRMFGPQFVLQPHGAIGSVAGGQDHFDIAAGSGRFTEIWHDYRQLEYVYELSRLMQHFVSFYGQTMDDGSLPNPPGTRICDAGDKLAIAWNGQNYLATMRIGNDIHACRISPAGAMLDAYNGFFVSTGTDACVASDGTDWFVAYTVTTGGGPRVYGVKISASGQVGYSGRLCSTESAQTVPNVAWTGGAYLVAFQDARGDGADIYAVQVKQDGTVLDPAGIAVCTAAGAQANPTATSLGTGDALVAWQDDRNGYAFSDVYAARISDKGIVLDPGGFVVCDQPNQQSYIDAAGFAGQYVVVWEDQRGEPWLAYRARVASDGTVLDPDGVPVYASATRWQQQPRVAADASVCLVGFLDGENQSDGNLVGVRFDATLNALDAQPIPLVEAATYQRSPALARTSSGFLAAFEETAPGPYVPRVYVTPLDADGAITAAGCKPVDTTSTHWQILPDVASDGTNSLVAWTDRNGEPATDNLLATRVDAQGNALDSPPLVICGEAGMQIDVRLAYGGGVCLAVWTDERSGRHIYGARIRPDGTVVDPGGFVICQCDGNHEGDYPRVVWGGSGFLVVWLEYWPYHDYAIKARFVDPAHPASSPAAFTIKSATHPEWVTTPAAASSGNGFLVTYGYLPPDWVDPPLTWICARRLAPDGTMPDASQLVLCDQGDNDFPVVQWDGSSYLVAWCKYGLFANPLYMSRVLESGQIVDPQGIPTQTTVTDIAGINKSMCTRGDGRTLLAWREFTPQSPYGIDRINERWINSPEIVHGIAAARNKPDDTLVTIVPKPTPAGTDDLQDVFYIEEPDRFSGMRVLWSQGEVPRDSMAAVTGAVETVGGERVVQAEVVAVGTSSVDAPTPLGLINKSIGGSSPAPVVPGIPGSIGLYNVGCLVRAWGRVTAVGDDWFYIDDGTGLEDGSGCKGVKVTVAGIIETGFALPREGDYALVTGLSSCEIPEGKTDPIRLLRPRRASDIDNLGP